MSEITCPFCGAPEVERFHPRTQYACGSSDFDQRPGTFKQSDYCALVSAMANRIRTLADRVRELEEENRKLRGVVKKLALENHELVGPLPKRNGSDGVICRLCNSKDHFPEECPSWKAMLKGGSRE